MNSRPLALIALLLATVGCNQRSPIFNSPALPSDTLPIGQPAVFIVSMQGVKGPASATGKVLLTLPAPVGGTEVFLKSSDPSVLSVPGSVVVLAGSDTAVFAATVQGVASDRDVQLTASAAGGRSVTTTVSVWSAVPTFCILSSDPGDYIGQGVTRRMVPPSYRFSASSIGNRVSLSLSGQGWWDLDFQAPKNAPLAVGTYEGATRYPFQAPTAPGLDVSGDGRGCNELSGRFTIREIDVAPDGRVRNFWATFEQHCGRGTPALFGEVRITQ